uniref:C3 and PZP-like alpha-2-macroglobulin domain-containing protein 8 n=1 Tax=Timema shepardi TaxID=629360 RepID=A0A7R9AY64_TIMSH|nr:unnamed protein product [Timema shepardi]
MILVLQMSVSTESRKSWNPKQEMNVSIVAQPGALVCLVGGRTGSGTDLRALDNNSTKSHKRFSFREMDFLDAGVAFFQRQCVRRGLGFDSQTQFYSHGSSYTEEKHKSVVSGTNIDNLWLWKCFSYRDNVSETITAPEEPGKWSLWVLSLAPNVGLRFSAPLAVSVFRPLQVDFQLPYSLKVGEAVEVDVRIGNNINSCMDVTALLALTEGAHFLSNNMLYVTEKLRLGPHGATSIVVRVVVTSPGNKNMTVQVSGYGSDSCRESSAPLNSTLVESVVRSATVLVHPEGLVRTDTESAYFCANEKMVISTSEEFRYEFVPAPRNRAGVVFEVKVSHGAHIVLSDLQYTSEQMYQVVLGDLDNTVTWIGRGKHGFGVHLKSKDTPQLLSGDIFRTFWLSWDKGVVAVGRGPQFHNDTLIEWRIDKKMKIQHLGFASGWGLTAEFRVWRYNNEAGFSQVLHLNVPRSVVPGTEQGTLTVSGGLSLPSTSQTAALLRHRHGLGESTSLTASISMFTPFLPLQHQRDLDNSSVSQDQVVLSLKKELQVLLTFMKPDFSFGDHRTQGSHRDTVTILELLSKVQSYLSVDPELMVGIKRWIQQRQSDDGSFSPLPNDTTFQDITANNKNSFKLETLHQNVEITAETLTTLLQVGLENEVDSEVMLRARYFLERSLFRVTSPCSLALLTFALVLAKSDLTSSALDRLQNYSTNEEGDFGWRESTNKDATDWLYEEGSGRRRKEPIMTSVGDYKASLFTLMTYSMLGDLKSAEPVARYLFYRSHLLDRHSELLYTAVKGFAMFGALAKDRHRALTVSLATSGMELTDTLEMRDDTPVQVLQLPSLPTKVFVYATGAGCATVQGEVSYSTYSPSRHSALLDLWAGVEDEIISGHNTLDQMEGKLPRLNLKTCFRWKAAQPSGVVRLEVTLFSGFQLTKVSPVVVDITGDMQDIHHGTRHDKIWFILANVSGACPVCVRYTVQSLFVVSALRPAFARVYPAGRADLGTETFFHTQRTSPLLADVTDDDIITWFGNKDMGQPHLSSDFAEVCECGRICVSNNIEVNNTSQPYNHVVMPNMEATNSIIFTNQTMKKHKTIIVPPSNSESPRVVNSERLFVLDKDTLWGMLREVVHGELQKNTLVIESSTKKNKQD